LQIDQGYNQVSTVDPPNTNITRHTRRLQMTQEKDIWEVVINMKDRTISAYTEDGNVIKFPRNKHVTALKWTRVSAGGHLIQALVRMVVDAGQDLR
jgi:hypothetical protein